MKTVMLIIGVLVIIEGIWFAAAPGSFRNFVKDHPVFATKSWMKTASDKKLRIYGIAMVIGALLLEAWIMHTMGIF